MSKKTELTGRGGYRPGAGRPTGSRGRRTQEVVERLENLGCDPLEGMVRIASQAEAAGDLNLAGRMYAELAPYVAPKLKSVEHSGPGGRPLLPDAPEYTPLESARRIAFALSLALRDKEKGLVA